MEMTTHRPNLIWSINLEMALKSQKLWVKAYIVFQRQPKIVAKIKTVRITCNSLFFSCLDEMIIIGANKNVILESISLLAALKSVALKSPIAKTM